ncbi:hypothetical protein KAR34_00770 [bacterium]|nr:hypothetical protein [bacterium]
MILDINLVFAEILKENLNMCGFNRVFLSTQHDLLANVLCSHHFKFIFIDVETIKNGQEEIDQFNACRELETVAILIHWEYTEEVVHLMKKYQAKRFIKKPYDMNLITEILNPAIL